MDDRQTKIREGAGLEDSRVNQEFIDFLNKWSTPFCILLLVAAGVYWGLNYLERQRVAKIDQAFAEFEAVIADGNPSPTSLKSIATTHAGTESIAEMARLREVDLYLGAYALGLEPGAQIDPVTQLVTDENDILDDDRRAQYLTLAETTAKQVLSSTENDDDKAIFAMQALSRLASVEESRDQFDAAKSYYERLGTLAAAQKYPSIKAFADTRIGELESLKSIGALPTNAQVPSLGANASSATLPMDLGTDEPIDPTIDAGTESDAQGETTDEPTSDEPTTTDTP